MRAVKKKNRPRAPDEARFWLWRIQSRSGTGATVTVPPTNRESKASSGSESYSASTVASGPNDLRRSAPLEASAAPTRTAPSHRRAPPRHRNRSLPKGRRNFVHPSDFRSCRISVLFASSWRPNSKEASIPSIKVDRDFLRRLGAILEREAPRTPSLGLHRTRIKRLRSEPARIGRLPITRTKKNERLLCNEHV